jgi:hypothetical protein
MVRSEDATVGGRPDPAEESRDGQRADERIDEMVEESFPASDPPTGWAGEDPRDSPGEPEGRTPSS